MSQNRIFDTVELEMNEIGTGSVKINGHPVKASAVKIEAVAGMEATKVHVTLIAPRVKGVIRNGEVTTVEYET